MTFVSLAEKTKLAWMSSVSMPGPSVIVVMGGVVSAMVHSHSAHSRAPVPKGSLGSTAKTCSPSASPV